MADLKKLAQGRKAFTKAAKEQDDAAKPEKSLEQSSNEELGELEKAFRERMAREDKRRRQATDSEFWFAVYFPDRESKHAFLRKYGLEKIGDKYLPGDAVDRVLHSRLNGKPDGHFRKR